MKDTGTDDAPIGGGPLNLPDPDAPAVSQDALWRARAERAEARAAELEARAAELEARVAGLEGELADTRAAHASDERRRAVQHELTAQQAIDLETCALLVEAAIGDAPEPDVAAVVRELRGRKPFLFAARAAPHAGSAMAPAGPEADPLVALADKARATGDRSALLRYLRSRRVH